jgi:hypothetical protein
MSSKSRTMRQPREGVVWTAFRRTNRKSTGQENAARTLMFHLAKANASRLLAAAFHAGGIAR